MWHTNALGNLLRLSSVGRDTTLWHANAILDPD
jgi:hypothetical protein